MKIQLITNRRESSDIKLAICCLGIVLIAWVIIGFVPGFSFMGADAVNSLLPMLYQLDSVQGDWHALAYRYDALGGTNLLGAYGVLPLSILFAEMGFSPLLSLNITFIAIQWLFCFLAVQSVNAFAGLDSFDWKPNHITRTIACCLLLGFAPLMAYRVDEGHQNLILGMLFVQALITFWQSHKNKQLSLTTFVAIQFALVHALCSPSFQILVYSLVFTLPILFCFFASRESLPDWRAHIATIGLMIPVVFLACLLAAPILFEMIAFAISDDSTRSVGQNPAIYSYLTSTPDDWFTSLFWFYDPTAIRPAGFQHEIRYGLGPLMISSLYLLLTRRYLVVLGLAGSLFLCLILSSRIEPFANWLLLICPPLQDFRVPMRSLIPVMVLWSTIVGGYLLQDIRRSNQAADERDPTDVNNQNDTKIKVWIATTLIIVTIAYYLPPLGQELLLLATIVISLFTLARNQPTGRNGLFIVSLLSLLAFREEINFLTGITPNLIVNAQIGNISKQAETQLSEPLNRIAINVSRNGLLLSSVGELQTVNGYGFPLRSFSETVQAMIKKPYSATTSYFNLGPGQDGFEIVQQLYNICCELQLDGNQVFTARLNETPGPIWASNTTKNFNNLDDMRGDLMLAENITNSIKKSQYRYDTIKQESEKTLNQPPVDKNVNAFASQCMQVPFSRFTHQLDGNLLTVAVKDQTMTCPVTVATSFSSQLLVSAIVDNRIVQIDTYPAYGSLLGFVMPKGTQSIVIEPRLATYPLSSMFLLLGLLLSLYIGYQSLSPQRSLGTTQDDR